MPDVERPDGARIHWEAHGEGPLLVIAGLYNSPPSVLEGLVSDLEADHRVVTYDLRGNGESSRDGPWDLATDVDDLGAVIEEAGAPAVVVALGDGCPRAVRLAAARPDLVSAVVMSGVVPLARGAGSAATGLAASGSVLMALAKLYEVDHRIALHSTLASGNPNLSEEQVRERIDATIAYAPREPGASRLRSWIATDVGEDAAALADRLWVLSYEGNPWFPARLADLMRTDLPDANFEDVEDGAITRPDLTAEVVRRLTADQRGG